MYILENAHSPNPRLKGAQTPSKLTHFPQLLAIYNYNIFPNWWQCISNTNVYSRKCTFFNLSPEGRTDTLQLTYIPQLLQECYRVLASLISWPGRLLSGGQNSWPGCFLGARDVKQIGTLPKGWQLKSSIKSFVLF